MTHGKAFGRLAAATLFLLALLFALAVYAPASLIGILIEQTSANRLTLAGASGRLWEGRGILTARASGARVLISWTLAPHHLLRLRLGGEITVGAAQPSRFLAGLESLELDQTDIALPAALVAEALGAYGGYKIGGTARLVSQRAFFHRDSASARLTLEWANASSGLIDVTPLGSYASEIEWIAGAGAMRIRTVEGPLFLDGAGRWSRAGAALSLDARASGERADNLKAWLRTMTPEQPDGRFRFLWPAATQRPRS